MHKLIAATAITAYSLLVTNALPASADSDGWGRDSQYTQKFNPKSIVTIKGKVTRLDREARPLAGMDKGFAATVQTDKGEEIVQVGPLWFTSYFKQKWDVQVGDQVEVTGSKVTLDGKSVIMAVQGKKGNLVMTCRSKSGKPVWDLEVEDFSIP